MAMQLTGDAALSQVLGQLRSKEGKAAWRKGCRAGGKIVQARLIELTPVDETLLDPRHEAGALRRDIRMKPLKRTRGARVGVRISVFGPDREPIGMFLDYGTKRHPGRDRLRKKGNEAAYAALGWQITPRNFAHDAPEQVGAAALQTAQRVMADELERRASQLGRSAR